MYLQTPLVVDGAANCVVAAAEDEPWAAFAQQVADAIEQNCGVRPAVVPASDVGEETLQSTNVIVPGIFCFNEVAEALYRREYILCDYAWPEGPESYVIRTVHNPWLSGTNVVFLGSTSTAGMTAAVDRFGAILAEHPDGVLPPIIDVSSADPEPDLDAEGLAQATARIAAETSSRSMGGTAAAYADSYFRSGKPEYAELFIAAMRKLDELQAAEGAADDVRTCRYIFHQFDRIEEGPAFSDDQRAELTNIFYRFAHRLTYAKAGVSPSEIPHGNNWNATGAVFAALYFSRYYPDLEIGNQMLEKMDVYYEPNMVNWKVNEDCPGYGNITLTGNYDWALHRPDMRFIDPPTKRLRRMSAYDMLITDNNGRVSGFGDSSGLSGNYLVAAQPLSAWLYQDGRFLWWWDHHGGQPTRYWVPADVLPRERPEDLLGVAVAPLDDWIYERNNYEPTREFPIDECFDKMTLRSGFDESDEYLSLSGFGYGFHSHPDANAIIRFADEGEVWLYDDGYMIPSLSEHNSIIVLRDGWAGRVPELSQVVADADFDDMGIFTSRLSDYNGVQWDRSLIWAKDDYVLVLDELEAEQPGRYDFQCIYRTLGDTELDGRRWTARKTNARMTLIAASDSALSQKQSAGTSLNAKPFSTNEARRLIESAGAEMARGDSYHFGNLFYADPADAPERGIEVVSDGRGGYLIDEGPRVAMAGVGYSATAGLRIDAAAWHLSGETLHAAGLESLRFGGPMLSAEPAVDAQIDLRTGVAIVTAAGPTRLSIGGDEQQCAAGTHEFAVPAVDAARLARIADTLGQRFAALSAEQHGGGMAETGDGIAKLWEYTDFDVYRDFTNVTGATITASARQLEPEAAGYPVGDPQDLLSPGGNVMFPDGETVVLDIDLLQPRELTRVVVNSRQLKTFNGGCGVSRITAWASDDRTFTDADLMGSVAITEPLQNAMIVYPIEPEEPMTGRYVRIECVPWSPEHNVYLDSIALNGKGSRDDIAASGFHLNALEVADIDGDGTDEAFAGGTDKAVHAVGADGSRLWKYRVGDSINDLTIAGAGDATQVVAGSDDHKLYSVTAGGDESWTIQPPPRTYARPGYRGVEPFTGSLTVVFDSDLDVDGDDEIIVGSANWHTYVYDLLGELVWDEVLWAHTPTCGAAFNLDGEDGQELVMCNSYTSATVYASDGEILGNADGSGHAGPTDIAAADLDGNGLGEIVTGDRAGMIWFREWQGRDMPDYNAGSDITCVKIADITGDEGLETVVASKNYLLYVFDANGMPLWMVNLGDAARDIDIADVTGDNAPEIVLACEDNTVRVLDNTGAEVARFSGGGWMRQVRVCELDGDEATTEIVASCDDGTIYGLQIAAGR